MYKCKYCGKEFESKQKLGGHSSRCKDNPSNQKVYNCIFCYKEFNNLSGLHRHEKQCKSNPNGVSEKHKVAITSINRDDLFCKFCGKQCKNENSLRNHERMCTQNPDQSYREKFNTKNNIGHSAWNKGLTKETDPRVAKCGKTYSKNHSLGLHKTYENGSKRPEVKEKISRSCLKRSQEGTWYTSLAKDMHIQYKGEDLHGSWELKYAQYLDSKNIVWLRNKERFLYVYKDKQHYYTPDFYLPDANEYIEIKGYKTGKDYAKWKQFPKDKKLTVLAEKELLSLGIQL